MVSAGHGGVSLPYDHHHMEYVMVLTLLNFLLRMSLFMPFMVEVGLTYLEVNYHWLLTKAPVRLICQ